MRSIHPHSLMNHFTLPELCASVTAKLRGINNMPNFMQASNLEYLVDNLLDPLREAFGAPIIVQSGFRCNELNRLVGGVDGSYHTKGLAADISAVGQDRLQNKRLVELLDERNLPFDQCILYDHLPAIGPRWIHLNVRLDPTQNRRVYLRR